MAAGAGADGRLGGGGVPSPLAGDHKAPFVGEGRGLSRCTCLTGFCALLPQQQHPHQRRTFASPSALRLPGTVTVDDRQRRRWR